MTHFKFWAALLAPVFVAACDTPDPTDTSYPVLTVAVGAVSVESKFGIRPQVDTCPDGRLPMLPASVTFPRHIMIVAGAPRPLKVDVVASQGSGVAGTVLSLPVDFGHFPTQTVRKRVDGRAPTWDIEKTYSTPSTIVPETYDIAPSLGSAALPLVFQATGVTGKTLGESFTIVFEDTACA